MRHELNKSINYRMIPVRRLTVALLALLAYVMFTVVWSKIVLSSDLALKSKLNASN